VAHDSDGSGARDGITLVLGGGGARGLAHLGVLRVLEEAGIPVRAVVGNSAGAIMAASWLERQSAAATIEALFQFLHSPTFQRLGLSFRPQRTNEGPPPKVLRRILSGWRRHVAMHLLFRRASLFRSTSTPSTSRPASRSSSSAATCASRSRRRRRSPASFRRSSSAAGR
jgi:alpha-beta hydrolase superfamily lysophospholipase